MDVLKKARSLLSSGQLQESCELFSHFIHNHEDSIEHRVAVTDAYNSRGHVKYLSVDFPGAIEDYSQAIQRDPDFTIAWYNRGQVQYRLGESGSSVASLLTSIRVVSQARLSYSGRESLRGGLPERVWLVRPQ